MSVYAAIKNLIIIIIKIKAIINYYKLYYNNYYYSFVFVALH